MLVLSLLCMCDLHNCEVLKLILSTTLLLFRSGWSYLTSPGNYIEWLYILCTLVIIILRVQSHPGQWIVASLLYFVCGLKIFEFISLLK